MAYCIFASMLACGTLYLNITSFFPLFVQKRFGDQINTVVIAITLTSFNFAGVVCSPIHAVTISKMGRKNALMIGFVCIFLSNTALGVCALCHDPVLFTVCCCLARFFQGYGDSLAMATSFSMISINFPDKKEKYISLIGASMGIGLFLGPPLGSLIYGRFGFACVFYFFSIWILMMIFL
jgi:MFS family permease